MCSPFSDPHLDPASMSLSILMVKEEPIKENRADPGLFLFLPLDTPLSTSSALYVKYFYIPPRGGRVGEWSRKMKNPHFLLMSEHIWSAIELKKWGTWRVNLDRLCIEPFYVQASLVVCSDWMKIYPNDTVSEQIIYFKVIWCINCTVIRTVYAAEVPFHLLYLKRELIVCVRKQQRDIMSSVDTSDLTVWNTVLWDSLRSSLGLAEWGFGSNSTVFHWHKE